MFSQIESMLNGHDPNSIAKPLRPIVRYQGQCLKIGRPLDTVMIMMAGVTGSGKSTTINKVFDDQLCETGSKKAVTHTVSMISKLLTVPDDECPVKAYLSFVDVPGTNDDDRSREHENIAMVRHFRNECPLLNRKSADEINTINKFPIKVRDKVYPNLVLLTVDANDNRMMGPDSAFRQSLKILKDSNLVDTEAVNLIVVATHSMSLAILSDAYTESKRSVESQIFEIVEEISGCYQISCCIC